MKNGSSPPSLCRCGECFSKKMSIFKQKRQSPRKALMYYLETRETHSGRLIGRVVDITTEGLRLVSDDPAEVGRSYQLTVHLPEEIQGAATIDVETRCVRSEQDGASRYYYSGFQFRETSDFSTAVIETLIARYEF